MVATTAPPGASLSPNSTPFKSTCTWADALVQGLKKGSAMHFCEKELVEGLCNLQGKSVMLPPLMVGYPARVAAWYQDHRRNCPTQSWKRRVRN